MAHSEIISTPPAQPVSDLGSKSSSYRKYAESVELAGIDSEADFRINSLLDSSAVLDTLRKSSSNS